MKIAFTGKLVLKSLPQRQEQIFFFFIGSKPLASSFCMNHNGDISWIEQVF